MPRAARLIVSGSGAQDLRDLSSPRPPPPRPAAAAPFRAASRPAGPGAGPPRPRSRPRPPARCSTSAPARWSASGSPSRTPPRGRSERRRRPWRGRRPCHGARRGSWHHRAGALARGRAHAQARSRCVGRHPVRHPEMHREVVEHRAQLVEAGRIDRPVIDTDLLDERLEVPRLDFLLQPEEGPLGAADALCESVELLGARRLVALAEAEAVGGARRAAMEMLEPLIAPVNLAHPGSGRGLQIAELAEMAEPPELGAEPRVEGKLLAMVGDPPPQRAPFVLAGSLLAAAIPLAGKSPAPTLVANAHARQPICATVPVPVRLRSGADMIRAGGPSLRPARSSVRTLCIKVRSAWAARPWRVARNSAASTRRPVPSRSDTKIACRRSPAIRIRD